jgi:hypothetical protein
MKEGWEVNVILWKIIRYISLSSRSGLADRANKQIRLDTKRKNGESKNVTLMKMSSKTP